MGAGGGGSRWRWEQVEVGAGGYVCMVHLQYMYGCVYSACRVVVGMYWWACIVGVYSGRVQLSLYMIAVCTHICVWYGIHTCNKCRCGSYQDVEFRSKLLHHGSCSEIPHFQSEVFRRLKHCHLWVKPAHVCHLATQEGGGGKRTVNHIKRIGPILPSFSACPCGPHSVWWEDPIDKEECPSLQNTGNVCGLLRGVRW